MSAIAVLVMMAGSAMLGFVLGIAFVLGINYAEMRLDEEDDGEQGSR